MANEFKIKHNAIIDGGVLTLGRVSPIDLANISGVANYRNYGGSYIPISSGGGGTSFVETYSNQIAYVDTVNGSDLSGVIGSQQKPYRTIQTSINAITGATSANRFTVYIRPGTYTENISGKDFVTIHGQNTSSVVLSGSVTFGSSTRSRAELRNLTIKTSNASSIIVNTSTTSADINLYGVYCENTRTADLSFNNVIDLQQGILNCIQENEFNLTKTIGSASIRSSCIYYVNGSGQATLNTIGTSHTITTSSTLDDVSIIENRNTNTNTVNAIQSTLTNIILTAANPANHIQTFYHNGGTGSTYATNNIILSTIPATNSCSTYFGYCYNSSSTSKLELQSNYFSYSNNPAYPFAGASTHANDSLIIRQGSVKTPINITFSRETTLGTLGVFWYNFDSSYGSINTNLSIVSTLPIGIKNFIINGTGNVQQRPNATLSVNTYSFGPDRFTGCVSGTAVTAGSFRSTSGAHVGNTSYAHALSGVTCTGTGQARLRTRIDSEDSLPFKNQIASFSCKVWQDTGSIINYVVNLRKASAFENFSIVTPISSSSSIPVSSSVATTLKYENINIGDTSNGIEVEIVAACGATTLKSFEFTEIQLEVGPAATMYEHTAYQYNLNRCLRYYIRWKGSDADSTNYDTPMGYGFINTTTQALLVQYTPVPLRTPPTGITISSPGNFYIVNRGTGTVPTALSFLRSSPHLLMLSADVTGVTQGQGCEYRVNGVASAYMEVTGTEL